MIYQKYGARPYSSYFLSSNVSQLHSVLPGVKSNPSLMCITLILHMSLYRIPLHHWYSFYSAADANVDDQNSHGRQDAGSPQPSL